MSRLSARLRLIAHDALRFGEGLGAIRRNRWNEDPVDLCLGVLQSNQHHIEISETAGFSARLINPHGHREPLRLVLDFYSVGVDGEEVQHPGFFVWSMTPSGARMQPIALKLRLADPPSLEVEEPEETSPQFEVAEPAHVLGAGLWRVIFSIVNPENGHQLHHLEITQRFRKDAA